ncbi:MAG: hypothetical protein M1826_001029 [Phylliscum demangeonii]|nr:MAG: hypothetical protein M1826_001029 [Phylliscum demangeonii]
MRGLQFLPQTYSLDTLDPRFTTASPISPADSSNAGTIDRGQRRPTNDGNDPAPITPAPPRWSTLEFKFYYLVFLVVVPMMFNAVCSASKESHPTYPRYAHLLSPGWIPGRKVDNSDAQYANFRDNVPALVVVLCAHVLLRRIYNYIWSGGPPNASKTRPSIRQDQGVEEPSRTSVTGADADLNLRRRQSFDLVFSAIFISALHGFSALKILFILYVNYRLTKRLPRARIPIATWLFNIGILFTNKYFRGYAAVPLAQLCLPHGLAASSLGKQTMAAAVWLDGFGGLIPRWEILFNITVLRLISFNLDYYWSLGARRSTLLEKKELDPGHLSERDRLAIPARMEDYSFRRYLTYALYPPLYLAGPIITFNDYVSQIRYPTATVTPRRNLLYGIRGVLNFLFMELMLHFMYPVAISKSNPDWKAYTAFQMSMLAFFQLHIIWLKLLIPWRFFRLWALMDGVDPPENMVRCPSNNYSTVTFWRGWHRSYNRWCIRYIYIPLGGNASRGKARIVRNFLVVFMFVGFWHDIDLQLLIWGWLVVLFIVPELTARALFPPRKWARHPDAYRMLAGFGGVANLLMIMIASLVGFAMGVDGLRELFRALFGSRSGLVFVITAWSSVFVAVQIMFEWREEEARKGIRMKC